MIDSYETARLSGSQPRPSGERGFSETARSVCQRATGASRGSGLRSCSGDEIPSRPSSSYHARGARSWLCLWQSSLGSHQVGAIESLAARSDQISLTFVHPRTIDWFGGYGQSGLARRCRLEPLRTKMRSQIYMCHSTVDKPEQTAFGNEVGGVYAGNFRHRQAAIKSRSTVYLSGLRGVGWEQPIGPAFHPIGLRLASPADHNCTVMYGRVLRDSSRINIKEIVPK